MEARKAVRLRIVFMQEANCGALVTPDFYAYFFSPGHFNGNTYTSTQSNTVQVCSFNSTLLSVISYIACQEGPISPNETKQQTAEPLVL